MGNQDDGFPFRAQPVEDAEQLIGLRRGQHAGGLIKDQDLRLAVERLEDLDPLLHANADLVDAFVGIDIKLVFFLQLLQFLSGAREEGISRPESSAPSTMFSRTVKFSTSLKCWNTMPMLKQRWRRGCRGFPCGSP